MKKIILFIAVIVVMLSGCTQTNEQKAQSLIKKYMKTHLNDPKSYEVAESGTLDSLYSELEHDFDYIRCESGFDAYYKMFKEAMEEDEFEYAGMYADSMGVYSEKLKIIEENFKPEFIGWTMQHSFRAKNALGAMVLETKKVNFDMEFTKITNTADLD